MILDVKETPRKRTVLQTLSRTLTPSKRSPVASPVHVASAPHSNEIREGCEETRGESLANLAGYLTTLSGFKEIRGRQEWTAFFRVGKEDLESKRVERRYVIGGTPCLFTAQSSHF
jgi:hypothetical protein